MVVAEIHVLFLISEAKLSIFHQQEKSYTFFFFNYLFIWLPRVLVAASLGCSTWDLHCIARDVSLQCRFSSCGAWVSAVGLQYLWYMVLVAPQHVRC